MIYGSSPAWSMKGRYPQKKVQPGPTPTTYNPSTPYFAKDPQWKIGTSQRDELCSSSVAPGPGKYECFPAAHCNFFGKFGKQNVHLPEEDNEIPGPGTYSPLKRPTSPSISMGKKIKIHEKKASLPGPGTYEVPRLKKVSALHFCKQQRFIFEKSPQRIPGPGTYEAVRPASAQLSFPKQARNCDTSPKQNAIPGPGNYNYPSDFDSRNLKGFSVRGKLRTLPHESYPGPGQYDQHDPLLDRAPKFTMAAKIEDPQPSQTPGSQSYSPSSHNGQRSWSIGKALRSPFSEKVDIPGPGSYFAKIADAGPKFSLGGSRRNLKKDQIPGPGRYNPNKSVVQVRPHSAKIGTSKRSFQTTSTAPGPGTYDVRLNQTLQSPPKFAFTKELRNQSKIRQQPGPGEYSIPSTIANCPPYVK